MILKDIGFIKFLIELPESQKRWATVVCCAILLVLQVRRYEIREIDYMKKSELKFEKFRAEKNADLKACAAENKALNNNRLEDMRIFKDLYFETERMKSKIKQNDSINQKKN